MSYKPLLMVGYIGGSRVFKTVRGDGLNKYSIVNLLINSIGAESAAQWSLFV